MSRERTIPSSSSSNTTSTGNPPADWMTPYLPDSSIFSTPIYPEQRPSIFITPTYDGPTWQEGFTPWTGPLPQNITVPVDMPDMTVLESSPHKNSLDYVGETHVYRIIGPDGKTYKIGESAQGLRKRDGASIRAEQQARRLQRETGESYRSEVRQTYGSKKEAREGESTRIKKFRGIHGKDKLPGNKNNR